MPDYPDAIVRAVADAIERELMSGTDYGTHMDSDEALACAALDAAAPLLADAVARKIQEHADRTEPLSGRVPSARRRAFQVAVQVAAGAFTTKAESHRQTAAALLAGDYMACDPEAAMLDLARREGVLDDPEVTGA